MRRQSRSIYPRLVFVVILALLMSCRPAPTPPNVVIVLVDDMGYGDLSRYGSKIPTPRLDDLFSSGVVLNRFYSAPVCSPTRAGLLAGRHPVLTGIAPYVVGRHGVGLREEENTIAESFKAAGYETAMLGKWHLGMESHPNRHGFDLFYGTLDGVLDYFDHESHGQLSWQENGVDVEESGYVTTLLEDRAAAILGQARDRPLFLLISTTAVHRPLQATEALLQRVPESVSNPEHRLYAAMILSVDDLVGRVLSEEGIADNTILVFMSDNGPGRMRRASAGPFRSGKHSLYEGGVRVPAAILWPKHLAGGDSTDCLISTEDLYPTLIRLAGQSATSDAFDFTSCLPLLEGLSLPPDELTRVSNGADTDLSKRRFVYWLGSDGDAIVGYEGRWKMIRRRRGLELYDLATDEGEATNVADQHPDRVQSLIRELDRWERAVGAVPAHVPVEGTFAAAPSRNVIRIDTRNHTDAAAQIQVNIPILTPLRPGDRLEFDAKVESFGGAGEAVSYEMRLDKGHEFFADAGAVDQFGRDLASGAPLEEVGKWTRRVVGLGSGAPRFASSFGVRIRGRGSWRIWIDNLRILRADGSEYTIYAEGEPEYELFGAERFDDLTLRVLDLEEGV